MAMLCGDCDQSPDESSLLTTPYQKRLRVFLLEIIPNPDRKLILNRSVIYLLGEIPIELLSQHRRHLDAPLHWREFAILISSSTL